MNFSNLSFIARAKADSSSSPPPLLPLVPAHAATIDACEKTPPMHAASFSNRSSGGSRSCTAQIRMRILSERFRGMASDSSEPSSS